MKIRRKYLFYLLAFSSSIIVALISGLDVVLGKYIKNPLVFGLSIFYFGLLTSILFTLFLSISFKGKSIGERTIDPSFKKIRLLKKEELKYHILAGTGNAILTLGYFWLLILIKDPSLVLPFSQVVILYLVVIESIIEKNTPTLVEIQSSVIVTLGAILGSISLSGTISLESFAIVFLIVNPGWVLQSVYQRKLKMMKINDKSNDSINIRMWNVIFACLFTLVFVFFYDYYTGSSNFSESLKTFVDYFGLLTLAGIGAFFSYVFYIRALGIGKASITQAVKSSVIIFSIPISIALAYFGFIDPISTDPVLIIIRVSGIILMLLGIISFALTLIKAYIFIKMKPGYPIEVTMQKLWDINGVNRVTAVAGDYDFIVKIRTRTLVKGYERILRKIASIEGIKDYKWQSVLKEWEDI
ncbi:MAG: Lrp/AsnC ligand binding domain-containing protein [Thermoplasmatales archaeon]|nr:MAG: Lrp/AsnC ligand binding domain-containing protein [Thermoplasmatales archaeon]